MPKQARDFAVLGLGNFGGTVALELARFDPARPVVVEAESSKVGDLIVPPSLWAAMCAAPRIELDVTLAERAAFFPRAYADLVADPASFAAVAASSVQSQTL